MCGVRRRAAPDCRGSPKIPDDAPSFGRFIEVARFGTDGIVFLPPDAVLRNEASVTADGERLGGRVIDYAIALVGPQPEAVTAQRDDAVLYDTFVAERVVEEAKDPETAVILVDCVIGYGSHEDPAKDLSDAIRKAKELAAKEGRYLSVVATVCGTEGDPQNRTATSLQLAGAGAIVLPSNAQAARFVELITKNL